jgi:hypothetical protein
MSSPYIAYKRLTVVLLILTVFSFAGMGRLGWKRFRDKSDIAASLRVIHEYDKIRSHLDNMAIEESASYLEVIIHTTLVAENDDLTKILESARARMVHDVVESLRTKTGEDLGDSPEGWIRKYGPEGLRSPIKGGAKR